MAQTGLAKGLAVEHDFGADIQRLYQREDLRSQIRVEKERKAQLYGGMLEEGHVQGKFNTGRLEESYKQINDELANFVTNNPNWETDPGLFAQFSNITDQYLNNDIIREDMQVQEQFKALQGEINSGRMTPQEMEQQMDRYTNYVENGGDPYVFVNPKKFEFNEIIGESLKNIGTQQYTEEYETEEGIRAYRTIKEPNKGAIQLEVNSTFADPDRKREIEANYQQAGGIEVAETAQQYYENKLIAGENYARMNSGMNQYDLALAKKSLTGAPAYSYAKSKVYDEVIAAVNNNVPYASTYRQNNIVFSSFAKAGKPGGQRYITPSDGIEYAGKIEGETNNEFGYSTPMKSIGGGKITYDPKTGIPMVETDVIVAVAVDKNGKPEDPFMAETLTARGFNLYEADVDPAFRNMTKAYSVNTTYYTGTISEKATLDELTFNAFDEAQLGTEEMKAVRGSGVQQQMDFNINYANTMSLLNTKYPDANFVVNGQVITGEDDNYRYVVDAQTGDVYQEEK